MKRILITGKNSYIGNKFEEWVSQWPDEYQVDKISVRDDMWKKQDWSGYDVVLNVAGIAHKKESTQSKIEYFKVNRDLAIAIAIKAKESLIPHYILISTMAVYGEEGSLDKKIIINYTTKVNPKTNYGISKLEAENKLKEIISENFCVTILRPPMIYGPESPGNYQKLKKLVNSPILPSIENERSMLHVDNLSEYLKELILTPESGIFFPQDEKYKATDEILKDFANIENKKVYFSRALGNIIKCFFKNNTVVKKMYGSLVYEKGMK